MKRRRVARPYGRAKHFLSIPKVVWLKCILENHAFDGTLRICDVMRFCYCHPIMRAWSEQERFPQHLYEKMGYAGTLSLDHMNSWQRLLVSNAIAQCKDTFKKWVVRQMPYGLLYRGGDMKKKANWEIDSLLYHVQFMGYAYVGIMF